MRPVTEPAGDGWIRPRRTSRPAPGWYPAAIRAPACSRGGSSLHPVGLCRTWPDPRFKGQAPRPAPTWTGIVTGGKARQVPETGADTRPRHPPAQAQPGAEDLRVPCRDPAGGSCESDGHTCGPRGRTPLPSSRHVPSRRHFRTSTVPRLRSAGGTLAGIAITAFGLADTAMAVQRPFAQQ